MSVLSVKELAERRASSKKSGEVTHSLTYLVTCSDKNDGTAAAIDADGIPRIGDGFKGDTRVPCVSVDASPRQDSAVHFEVTAQWSSGQQGEMTDLPPLMRPPDYAWGAADSDEPWFKDHSDPPKVFANSVGESFSGLMTRPRSDLTIQMSRNEEWYDAAWFNQWANKYNLDTVMLDLTAYAPLTLRLAPVTASKARELWQGVLHEFYKLTYSFVARAETFIEEIEDRAFNELREVKRVVGGVEQTFLDWVPILDSTGRELKFGWPLNGEGEKLPNVTDPPAILEFQPLPAIPFAPLNLE